MPRGTRFGFLILGLIKVHLDKRIYVYLGFCPFFSFPSLFGVVTPVFFFFSMARELASLFSLSSFCRRRRKRRRNVVRLAPKTGWRRGRRRLLHRPPTERARIDPLLRSKETTIGSIIQKKKMSVKTSSSKRRKKKSPSRPF